MSAKGAPVFSTYFNTLLFFRQISVLFCSNGFDANPSVCCHSRVINTGVHLFRDGLYRVNSGESQNYHADDTNVETQLTIGEYIVV